MQTNLAGTYGTETYLKCTRMTKKKSTPNGVLFLLEVPVWTDLNHPNATVRW